ncbi:MAG: MucR family transcriptional regulator, partial [Amphiplicatus sp.]
MTETTLDRSEVLALTSEIVSAHVSNNSVAGADLPELISNIFATLGGLAAPAAAEAEPPTPAVPVKKSVTDDYIVCLEDGKKLKMLKRHLSAAYGMTPDEYRAKWGLPFDYPMVAPAYAQRRKELALKIGLGRKPGAKPAAKKGRAARS